MLLVTGKEQGQKKEDKILFFSPLVFDLRVVPVKWKTLLEEVPWDTSQREKKRSA